jgi:hypothetical protein
MKEMLDFMGQNADLIIGLTVFFALISHATWLLTKPNSTNG